MTTCASSDVQVDPNVSSRGLSEDQKLFSETGFPRLSYIFKTWSKDARNDLEMTSIVYQMFMRARTIIRNNFATQFFIEFR